MPNLSCQSNAVAEPIAAKRRVTRISLLTVAALGALCCTINSSCADEWPQWRGPQRDGVWREDKLVERFADKQLKLKWRVPLASGYSGPTVADGRVYVTDRMTDPEQIERVHCFNWENGETNWTHQYACPYADVGYQAGPRASVSIAGGRAFVLGTMGHLICLNAASGEVLWQHDLNSEYKIRMPIWGISASPLVDGRLVIVQIGGKDGACLVAFDAETGAERWRALEDEASYSAPIIIEQAGQRVLLCWTGDSIAGLAPATGEVYWRVPFERTKMVIGISTPVVEKNRVFVTSFYDGSTMIELDPSALQAKQLWRRTGRSELDTDALHSIISTPYFAGDYVYGVDSYGELRCLRADDGERVWEDLTAVPKSRWATIHMVRNGDRIWMFNERGELVIGKLAPTGFTEISRAQLIEPTTAQLSRRGGVCWAHPAYAYRHVFARNDKELVCASLAVGEQ